MKQGALIFDERSDRYDIRFDLADYYGGLHCGETFDVMVGGRWKPTRIEYGDNWYLVGIRGHAACKNAVQQLDELRRGATLTVPPHFCERRDSDCRRK